MGIVRGEVHGLVGANGAGKSTLIRCLAGVTVPDEGKILVDGEALRSGSPQASEKAGLAFIHQELSLFPNLSIEENLFLDHFPRVSGALPFIDRVLALPLSTVERAGTGDLISPAQAALFLPMCVRGRRGLAAIAFLVAALVTTQVYFPARYFPYVYRYHLAWVVFVRDLFLVGLFVALILPARSRAPAHSS